MTIPPRIVDSRGDPLVHEFNQWYQASAEDWEKFDMTTPPRIVIDRQTSRADRDRLVAVARNAARQRKQAILITRYAMIAFGFVAVAAAVVLAVLAAVGGL